ncbi:phytanoyl-CoA dioxygenase family protein [Xylogone sp. PMI_703]|nr:phytanoyl-CoA dioxygenase family protein [Xylogone sp. PMI_703]
MSESPKLSSHPIAVNVSPSEVAAKTLTWKNLELATRALHRDGLVVLENAIDHSKLDALNKKMVEDVAVLQAAGDDGPYNYNKGNLQQDPPLVKQYFEPSIILNELATQVTSSVLGPRPRLSFVSGNTAVPPIPGSEPLSQPVHSDADFNHPSSPFALVVNVPLIEMTVETGSTEVWLGTHTDSSLESQEGAHGERASGRIKLDLLEERRKVRPPSQPHVKKGSVVIRDLRLWHAGKPNFTNKTRVMLAMIHFAPWFRNPMQVEFSEELIPALKEKEDKLQIQAKFLPEKEVLDGYLHHAFGNAYDFSQTELLEGYF